MRLLCGVALLASGCDYLFLTKNPVAVDAGEVDAPSDARTCLGTGILQFCVDGALAPVELAGAIDTTTDERCRPVPQTAAPELCVIAGTTITTLDNVAIRGNRPLILAATSTIVVTSVLDAASRRGVKGGPGARALCGTTGDGANGTTSGGGGAGGTFGFPGGPGATGQAGASLGGSSTQPQDLVAVVGGCPGFLGGRPSPGIRARGGDGGGAIGLVAGEAITIEPTGRINASGASGAGGSVMATGGGGGGGAGGLILLDAPRVTVAGEVFARGGGGGGGGGVTAAGATAGLAGNEPTGATTNTGGGMGGMLDGGNGAPGCGSPNGTTGGFPVQNPVGGGGGGGGGGCGVIRIYGVRTINVPTNPAPTP